MSADVVLPTEEGGHCTHCTDSCAIPITIQCAGICAAESAARAEGGTSEGVTTPSAELYRPTQQPGKD
jgi:hypothetical protein